MTITQPTDTPGTVAPAPVAPARPARRRVLSPLAWLRGGTPGVRGDLVLLFVMAFTVRLVWAVIMPPWHGFDETEHFAYVNHLVEQGEPPGTLPYERQYPVYSRELQESLGNTAFIPLVQERPYIKPTDPVPGPAALAVARGYAAPRGPERYDSGLARASPYPPLYYAVIALPAVAFPDMPILSRLFAMRAVTALLGAACAVFAYLTAYTLFRRRAWGLALGVGFAFLPGYVTDTALVNNDVAANLGGIVLLWLAACALVRPTFSPAIAAATVAVSALTYVSKPSVVAISLAVALVVAAKFPPVRRALRWSRERWWRAMLALAVAAGCVVVALALIAARSDLTLPAFLGKFTEYLRMISGGWEIYTVNLHVDAWGGRLGWGGVYSPGYTPQIINAWCAVGLVGAVVRFLRRPAERPIVALLVWVFAAQMLFLMFAVDFATAYLTTGGSLPLQGRYYLPAFGAFLLLAIMGWAYFFRDHPLLLRSVAALSVVLSLVGMMTVFARYYYVVLG